VSAIVVAEAVRERANGAVRVAAASAAAREALRRALAIAGVERFELAFDERGAPRPFAGWHWSLAHTRELALAALARSRIGVDLELANAPRVAKLARVFDDDELALLGSRDASSLARLWTAKEAVLKLAGVGIAELSLVRLECIDPNGRMHLRHRGEPRAVLHRSIGTHVAALCLEDSAGEVDWRADWSIGVAELASSS
jgi:4'-phosphopantetheinyl transferase